MTAERRRDRQRALVLRLSAYTDAALVDALAVPENAGPAAALLRERLVEQPDGFATHLLEAIAGLHGLSRRLEGGLTGPLPLAALRSCARAEIARRGGEAWRLLCPPHRGVRCLAALDGHDGEVRALRPLAGGVLASDEAGGERILWDLSSGRRLAPLRREDGVGEVAVLRWRDGAVAVSRPGERRAAGEVASPRGSIRAVAGGRFALVEGGSHGATVSVREVASGRVLWSRAGYEWDFRSGDALDVELSPAGRFLAIGQGYGGCVEIVEIESGRSSAFASEGPGVCLIALAGEPLVVLSQRGRTVVRDLDAGVTTLELEGCGPAALDGGSSLLLRGVGSGVELRDRRGIVRWQREVHGAVDQVFLTAGGELCGALARGDREADGRSYRSVARLWDRAGAEIGAIGGAYAVAPLPGGRELATGGRWGTIWHWVVVEPPTAGRSRPTR